MTGRQHQGTKFWCQQKPLATLVISCKFKKNISLKSDFMQFFHDFIHVYSPRTGADSPQGTKFWCQQKCLVTSFICCKFQRNLFEVWCYTIFFMIQYMYIALGQRQTAPWGQNFDVNRKALSPVRVILQFYSTVFFDNGCTIHQDFDVEFHFNFYCNGYLIPQSCWIL